MATRFEWDAAKAEVNAQKHGVTFQTASRAFADPYAVSEIERIEDGEHRWQTIAMVDGVVLLLIVHSDWEHGDTEVIRLISARRADRSERARYEKNYRAIRD
jgi:uncharacterized protein